MIKVPASKSYANRLLILGALSKKEIILRNVPNSTDVLYMKNALKKIGLLIEETKDYLKILNSFPECEISDMSIDTGDGGTTNRFLEALLSLGKYKYEINSKFTREIEPLRKLLKDENIIEVDCSKTTQFASALMLIGRNVLLKNHNSSDQYIKMTIKLIEEIKIKSDFLIPPDFSSIAFIAVWAALNYELKISDVKTIDTIQADSKLFDFLAYSIKDDILSIPKQIIPAIDLDCSQCPDLVPCLCFLGAYSKNKTILRNLNVLRFKESDRVSEVMRILYLYKVPFEYENNTLVIFGNAKKNDSYIVYDAPKDHRIIMLVHLFMKYNGGGVIHNKEHVAKSFPEFFELMSELE